MIKRAFAVLLALLFIPNIAYAKEINISAQSAVVIDSDSGKILFERNKDIKRAVASTTKVMTCLIACESKRLNETVIITDEMLSDAEGSSIYLESGDEITLYDLVCGAMIASGNDAANAIAVFLSGSLKAFSKLMNERAKKLGMKNTLFVTPSGLDKSNNHSTAYDMALLAKAALQNEELIRIASMKSAEITVNGKEQTIYNHNKLLSYNDNFIGLKTGYTEKAGRCLISIYKYSNNHIICVTLSAPDDWEDHKRLVKYAKKCYKNISKKEKLKISVVGGCSDLAEGEYSLKLKTLSAHQIKTYYYPFIYAPVRAGDIIGRADVYIGEKLIKSADIKATKDVERWQTMR